MALIRKTLPGATWSKEFSAERIAASVGTGTIARTAADIVSQRMARRIGDNAPYETGVLEASVTAKINLRKGEVKVQTVNYGGYQNEGTPTIEPKRFVDAEVTSNRRAWEADLRATVKTLEKRAAAAEKKTREPKGRGR